MLGKLAYRNAKRSIKDYLIYLITITLSFSLILAFNLVARYQKNINRPSACNGKYISRNLCIYFGNPYRLCIQSVYICNHRKTAQNTENNLHLCKLCVYRNAGCLLSADLPFSSSKSVKTNKENDCTRFSLL